MYLVGVLTAFLMGGCFAPLLVRLTLLTPSHMLLRPGAWSMRRRTTGIHAARRHHAMFLFILLAVPASLGNFVTSR